MSTASGQVLRRTAAHMSAILQAVAVEAARLRTGKVIFLLSLSLVSLSISSDLVKTTQVRSAGSLNQLLTSAAERIRPESGASVQKQIRRLNLSKSPAV